MLVYGHLDKQPEMTGWREGLGPWTPVIEGGRLYGRGGADDGYAVFCALAAIRSLEAAAAPPPAGGDADRGCEESGSYDLPAYLEPLAPRIGKPDLVICLDSGCGNYDQLWGTTSLRGLVIGVLTVEVLTEGVHSGDASGVVASSFRVARMLLDRIDDSATGIVRDAAFHAPIPPVRAEEAKRAAKVLGARDLAQVPVRRRHAPDGGRPRRAGAHAHLAALPRGDRCRRPAAARVGGQRAAPEDLARALDAPAAHAPCAARGARAEDAARVGPALRRAGIVRVRPGASGWHAPETAPWLAAALERASKEHYGKPMMWMGEGGTIPFMAMLGEKFPAAQFVITGVLGPRSNAHGPNEFLHLDYAKRLTACVADVIAAPRAAPPAAPKAARPPARARGRGARARARPAAAPARKGRRRGSA